MKIALYHRHIAPADLPALRQLVAALEGRGVETFTVADGDALQGADFLLSVGGDGTLLSAVQLILGNAAMRGADTAEAFPPIVGINFGHLGFLTTVGKDDIGRFVDDLLAGRYSVEERTLLQVATNAGDGHSQPALAGREADGTSFALNEVFVHRGDAMSLLRTHVCVDGDFVATYAGDGVIVATPTGSTAYSLSCGGPILTPNSRSLVVTPISAHTLTLRPIILPDSATLRLDIEGEQFSLGIDSRRLSFHGTASLLLSRAPFTIRLIRTGNQNFFSAIRDKLMWGTEVRQ